MTAGASKSGAGAARSLARGLAMIEHLHAQGPATVAALVDALAIPKSSAYEIVGLLVEAGWVARAEDGRIALGRRLHEVGQGYAAGHLLLREGGPVVRSLRDETGETVQLSALDGDHMVVLLKEEGLRAVRIISRAGSRVPVNWAAAGRLLVSDLDDEELRRLLAATVVPSPTGRAETDVGRLMTQVRAFRAQGHALEIGETNEHAGCVAAPVMDGLGRCAAAISIAAPEQRLASAHRPVLVEAVVRAALALSKKIT